MKKDTENVGSVGRELQFSMETVIACLVALREPSQAHYDLFRAMLHQCIVIMNSTGEIQGDLRDPSSNIPPELQLSHRGGTNINISSRTWLL